MSFLLDTMVVSESSKAQPSEHVAAWMKSVATVTAAISVVTIGEILFGISRLAESPRRRRLRAWFDSELTQLTALPIDRAVAEHWAQLRAEAGRTLPTADALIAATALAYDLVLVTRNAYDFAGLSVRTLNPYEPHR